MIKGGWAGLIVIGATLGIGCKGGPFTTSRDLVVHDPVAAVRDARALIEERKRDPERYWDLRGDAVPASLRVPGLKYLRVHADHVDLVLARNPDFEIGGRIWAVEHRPHRDEPTRYQGVFFYDSTNDLPEDPDNIR